MAGLDGQRILLGVSGGIAAYKSAELLRRLQDAGAEVRVVMTASALHFVGATTFQALSRFPVRSSLWDADAEAAMSHIELARWATRILVAPATANVVAKLAQGRANDLLSTLCLASEAPVMLAPAMNRVMWGTTPPPAPTSPPCSPVASSSSARAKATRPAVKPAPAACWSPTRSSTP